MGVPLATAKCEGPTSCLTFLGIELDTAAGAAGLTADKLASVRSTLPEWRDKKACRRRRV